MHHRTQVHLPSLLHEQKTTYGFQQQQSKNLKNIHHDIVLRSGFSAKRGFFHHDDEFLHKIVMGFQPMQELALMHKAGRTGRKTKGLSRHEWSFSGFYVNKTGFTGKYSLRKTYIIYYNNIRYAREKFSRQA